jgi:hypothetical protein
LSGTLAVVTSAVNGATISLLVSYM